MFVVVVAGRIPMKTLGYTMLSWLSRVITSFLVARSFFFKDSRLYPKHVKKCLSPHRMVSVIKEAIPGGCQQTSSVSRNRPWLHGAPRGTCGEPSGRWRPTSALHIVGHQKYIAEKKNPLYTHLTLLGISWEVWVMKSLNKSRRMSRKRPHSERGGLLVSPKLTLMLCLLPWFRNTWF